MSASENYIPQSENLEPFNKIVAELQSLTKANTPLKNSIVGKVDGLINQLNKGHTDNSQVIKKLNQFIQQFDGSFEPLVGDSKEGQNNNENEDEEDEEEAQLLQQNTKLKEILNEKIQYNEALDDLSNEYQEAIDQVVGNIRDTKSKNDDFKFKNFQRITGCIEELQNEEFEAYEQLANNNHVLSKLCEVLVKLSKQITDDDYANEVEVQKHLATLERLKFDILEDKTIHHREALKRSAWAKRAQENKMFTPSSSRSSISNQSFPSLGETFKTGVLDTPRGV